MQVNVGLAVRNPAQLDDLIAAASTPGSPSYGRYLTQEEYLADFAPTDASVGAARAWLASNGLTVTNVSPDNLIIGVEGSVSKVEGAFGVSIESFRDGSRSFYANTANPTVPSNLSISWVGGLNDAAVIEAAHSSVHPASGYSPNDLRKAYNVSGAGTGQSIGFTLWGAEIPQSDFNGYASDTATTAIKVGQSGADGLDWVQVDGASSITSTAGEIALDTEIAHGVAPGSHLTYWLAHDNSFTSLEDAVNAAANSTVSIVSNSWGCVGPCFDPILESALQHGAATGKSFYFSSGDKSENLGAQYPAYSQYAVAVGGTALGTDASGAWSSETGWGDGSSVTRAPAAAAPPSEPRPVWQVGVGAATCSGRAIPDVSADADPATCAYVFSGGVSACSGGTSLSAPIWAAIAADWNVVNAAAGKSALGFSAPLLYQLGIEPGDRGARLPRRHQRKQRLPGGGGLGSGHRLGIAEPRQPQRHGRSGRAHRCDGDGRRRASHGRLHAPGGEPRGRGQLVHGDRIARRATRLGHGGPDHRDRADERDDLHLYGDGDEQCWDGARVGCVEQCCSECTGDSAGCPYGCVCGRGGCCRRR